MCIHRHTACRLGQLCSSAALAVAGVPAATEGTLELPPQKSRKFPKFACARASIKIASKCAVPGELRRCLPALRGGSASLNARPASERKASDLRVSGPNLVNSCQFYFC